MTSIKKIIDDIENSMIKHQYINTQTLMGDVGEFVKNKKLLLYGGFAINLLLPKSKRFYKDYTVNDYDCFSKTAKKDAYELAQYLKNKKYKYIKVRKALHDNTFKVIVNFVVVADITQVEKKKFDNLMKISESEKKSELYKYYKNDYKLVPFAILFSNMHFELARPLSSYYRWEKILKRLELLQSIIPKSMTTDIKKNNKSFNVEIFNQIDMFLKENKIPRVDTFMLEKYEIKWKEDRNDLSILSMIPKKTIISLTNFLKERGIESNISSNVIKINDMSGKIMRIFVLDTSKDCFSIKEKKNELMGTPHTIIYFLYMNLLNNIDFFDLTRFKSLLALERLFLNKTFPNPNTILTKDCYGNNLSFVSILKDKWKERQTLKYF
jgi:hypothetical protein